VGGGEVARIDNVDGIKTVSLLGMASDQPCSTRDVMKQ